jgi:hypothetical protein
MIRTSAEDDRAARIVTFVACVLLSFPGALCCAIVLLPDGARRWLGHQAFSSGLSNFVGSFWIVSLLAGRPLLVAPIIALGFVLWRGCIWMKLTALVLVGLCVAFQVIIELGTRPAAG